MTAAIFALLGTIVGGVIAMVGNWALETRKQEAEQRKKREEKLVDLVAALYEHKHWLGLVQNNRMFEGKENAGISPFVKAEAIATVYFPEFLSGLAELDIVSQSYELWMFAAARNQRATGSIDNDGLDAVYKPYIQKLTDILREIKGYAARSGATLHTATNNWQPLTRPAAGVALASAYAARHPKSAIGWAVVSVLGHTGLARIHSILFA